MAHNSMHETLKRQAEDSDTSSRINSRIQLSHQQLQEAIADLKHQVQQVNRDARLTLQLLEDTLRKPLSESSGKPSKPSGTERLQQLEQLTAAAIAIRKRAERWLQKEQKTG